jgi:AcrR family transcriptional regulator
MSTVETDYLVMTGKVNGQQRTQAQRRRETRAALLSSARRLFGEQGYDGTSLEDIAEDCNLTIRPIYYHFDSKQGLFRAVNEQLELQALDTLHKACAIEAWEGFVAQCEDPTFRQVVLVDAPNVLGRNRWPGASALPWCRTLASETSAASDPGAEMAARVALATLCEAAMMVAEADYDGAREIARDLISTLLPNAP